jgi:glycosidase
LHKRFSYQALTAGKYEVGIAGDFTKWKILSLQDFGGLYLIDFDLKPGRYRYKYIIDGVWKTDPANPNQEADPFGGANSVIEIHEELPIRTWSEALSQAAEQDARSFINCHRPAEDALELRFSWYYGLADEISLVFSDTELSLYPLGRKSGLMLWHTQLAIHKPRRFHVRIGFQGYTVYLGLEGCFESPAQCAPLVVDPSAYPVFQVPDWLAGSVIYQIFVDRFNNGDPGNDQDFREAYYAGCREQPQAGELLGPNREYFHLVRDWKEISNLKQSPWQEAGIPDWHCFYGGDIAGVLQKLDYLCDIGINLIYFNPLWEARSNHKYDAADFSKPDPHFATEAEMKQLVKMAHAKGIRVILDVAFNHSGECFWAFRDTVEKGKDSPFWHWYDWYKWPLPDPLPADFKPKDYYQCWWGIKDMPDLNFDLSRRHPFENYIRDINNAEVNWDLVNHILDSASRWISVFGMDGFRLDVPDEVPWWFWQLFRERIKSLKPDAWLVGEIWHNADAWVSERYFDSVMNYAYFKNPVLEFFVQKLCTEEDFKLRIEEGLAAYPAHAGKAMMNLLGSHDTLRLRYLAKGDFLKIKHAVFFQMTFIGIPHIYYGDEIGMDGGKDPDNRRPFNWDWEADAGATELREFYKRLIATRAKHKLLRDGEFSFVNAPTAVLAYKRYNREESLVCAINCSETDKLMPESGTIIFSAGKARHSAEGLIIPAGAMCIVRMT